MTNGTDTGSATFSGSAEKTFIGIEVKATLGTITACAQQQMQLSEFGGECFSKPDLLCCAATTTEQSDPGNSQVTISNPVKNTRKSATKRKSRDKVVTCQA
jgi:hypothetical protein